MSSILSGSARAGALSVLEECIDALAVYQRTLKNQERPAMHTRLDIDWRMPLPEVSHSNYYGNKNGLAAFEMANQEVIFEKLRQDSQWLEQLMRSARQSLEIDGHLGVLMEEVVRKITIRTEEDELLARAHETQQQLQLMRQEIFNEQQKHNEEEEALRKKLLELRNEKEQLEVKSRVESSYVKSWLDSRREQEHYRVKLSREQLTNKLQQCRVREENEQLVTNKVEMFLRQSIEEGEESARSWAERRQTETKRYEKEIRRLREEIEKQRAELEELQQEYQKKQEFIDGCLADKEAARRQRELEEHMCKCAITIEAWWRGVMVRRKLGPYRPEEKKRKRPGKAKK